MKFELLPENGQFYKVNLHCHTTISDGKLSPEEIKEAYKAKGYSAVAFTDHEVLIGHEDLCDEDFVALHGYELAIKPDSKRHSGTFMPVHHFNAIAKREDNLTIPIFFKDNPSYPGNADKWIDKVKYSSLIEDTVYDKDWINGYLKTLKDAGFLITYNHPQWSLQPPDKYLDFSNLHAIEVINGSCSEYNDNTSLHFELMLRNGMKVFPFAGDDNHAPSDCFHGWTMVKAEKLTYESITDALSQGDCYVSEGPSILSLIIEDGKIKVKTSPVSHITILSEGRYLRREMKEDSLVTEAEFDYVPEKFGSYFRIEIRDEKGYKAFSRAYFTEDISL